jgi:hypothetical protein
MIFAYELSIADIWGGKKESPVGLQIACLALPGNLQGK